MAETPIEQFCEDLLRDKNLKNDIKGSENFYKNGINQMRNNMNDESEYNHYNDDDNDDKINGNITSDGEHSAVKNVPQNVSSPSWINERSEEHTSELQSRP